MTRLTHLFYISASIFTQSGLLVSAKVNTHELFFPPLPASISTQSGLLVSKTLTLTSCLFTPVSLELYTVRALSIRKGQYLQAVYSTFVSFYLYIAKTLSCRFHHLRPFAQQGAPSSFFCIVYGIFAGSFSCTWPAIMNEVQKQKNSAESTIVCPFLVAGRGIDNMGSRPFSKKLSQGFPGATLPAGRMGAATAPWSSSPVSRPLLVGRAYALQVAVNDMCD
jgi:hypothetical protein